MIIQNELKKAQNLLSGRIAYFDPAHNSNLKSSIRILPLLIDKTLVYVNKNNYACKSLIDVSSDLFEEGLMIPVSLSEENLPERINTKKGIFRNKIFDESLFSIEYKEAIEKDYEDDYLKDLIKKKICQNGSDFDKIFSKTSYSFNWSLILSQVLNVPLIMDKRFQEIAGYKSKEIIKSYYYTQSLNHLNEIKSFISTINPVLPANLSIDKIKLFRKERIVIQFRKWLEKSIYAVYGKQHYDKIEVDKYLVKEFSEVSKSYAEKNNLISYSMSGAMGGLIGYGITGSATGGAISGAVGTMAGYPFSKLIKYLWEKKGPNPWIFLVTNFK